MLGQRGSYPYRTGQNRQYIHYLLHCPPATLPLCDVHATCRRPMETSRPGRAPARAWGHQATACMTHSATSTDHDASEHEPGRRSKGGKAAGRSPSRRGSVRHASHARRGFHLPSFRWSGNSRVSRRCPGDGARRRPEQEPGPHHRLAAHQEMSCNMGAQPTDATSTPRVQGGQDMASP